MGMDNLPSSIGNCRLVSKLGQGGMGAVYRATHETLGREVAIKMLPTEFTQNHEYVQRFLREARAAAHLKHPNIVQVYDAGEQSGRYYISMEFVDGKSLAALLKERGPLSETEALRLMIQAAHGLAAAHAQGMVHRDIKPENLMLDKDGTLKVADFGLVTAIRKDENLTQDGAMLGTPAYMSPEQCEGLAADARSDVYSLGATFFRLMTGTAPFSASTPIGILFKHKHEPAPDPRSINPGLSESTALLLLKMMAKQQQDRFPSAGDVAAAAETIVRGERPAIALPHPGAAAPGSSPSVGAITHGSGGMGIHSAPTHAYTPPPGAAASADTPTWTPGAHTPLPAGTPVYTPTGMPAISPAQMGPTVITTQQPAVVPGTTIMQPAPRSALPMIAAAAILFMLLAAGGAYYGLVAYPQGQIDLAKRTAQEQRLLKQHEVAIQTLDAAYLKYPHAADLKSTRDAIEAEWLRERIAQFKETARGAVELARYDDAVKAIEDAQGLDEKGRALPGYAADAQLATLRKKFEDQRDYAKFMDQGLASEKDKRYADAVAAYEEARKYEPKGSREAQASAARAAFQGHLADVAKYESENNFKAALNAAEKAATLKVEDVTKLQDRLQKRIQHDQLVAEGETEQAAGNLRPAASRFEQAAALAANDSAAEALRGRARDLVLDADFGDAMRQGQAALKDRQWPQAEDAFRKAAGLKAKDLAAPKGLAQAQAGSRADRAAAAAKAGQWADAAKLYAEALELDPQQPAYAAGVKQAQEQLGQIESLLAQARDAEGAKNWELAADKFTLLAGLEPTRKQEHEARVNNARFELGMARARSLAAEGRVEDAIKAAQGAMPYDVAGGQRAQVEIQALQAKLQARNAAAARAQALDSAVQQVRQGRLSGALAILAEAAKADPGNGQIQTLKLSLEDVIAIEKAYGRLEEVRMDARAAIEMGLTCDKDDKKMKSWLASVDEWKDRLSEGRHTARGAWLDQKFDGIKSAYDSMRGKAQETAQLYTSLAANFAGKSASAAKPKANIGGLVGGYGGGAFGGIGGSGDIGDNQKHAGVYKGSSDALARCAEEARRLSAE